ncbi:MAG: hypothetical protein NWQ45_09315, partial [Congregibacter sp.]|nr:hypothetical protein [Congregibacter sp.]
AYNALSDASFRVRMLDLTYRDTSGRGIERRRAGFLIESDRELAERLALQEVDIPQVALSTLDPEAITLLGLFQFMIGNTDWSLLKGRGGESCCHNGLLLQNPAGAYVIVPYDFDQAGLIDADYALPARGLDIRSVRQRLFRGLCTGDERLLAGIELMQTRRLLVEAQFSLNGSNKRSNRRALDYIDDFYRITATAEGRQEWIGEHCRASPDLW